MTAMYQLDHVYFDYGTDFSLTNVNLDIKPSTVTALARPAC